MHKMLLTGIGPLKPLGHYVNISLTLHYNPIIQPMFTAILVFLLRLDSFYFIVEFITHTSRLPTKIVVPLGPLWWKIYLPQCPLKLSEKAVVSFVVLLRLFNSCPFISSSARGTHGAVTCNITDVTFYMSSKIPYDIWKGTNRRFARSRQGHPRSRSPRHITIVWQCTCFLSRQTGSTSMMSLQRAVGKKFQCHKSYKVRRKQQQRSSIPYRRGLVPLIKTQQVCWLLFAPWLACFPL